jgi:hypothetical protein
MLLPRHREDPGFGDIEFLSMLPAVHFHSSLLPTHDVIKSRLLTITFTTAVFKTEAAYGGLKPPPTRRLRRAHLHLSYSMALARLLDTIPTKNFVHIEITAFAKPEWVTFLNHAGSILRCA